MYLSLILTCYRMDEISLCNIIMIRFERSINNVLPVLCTRKWFRGYYGRDISMPRRNINGV